MLRSKLQMLCLGYDPSTIDERVYEEIYIDKIKDKVNNPPYKRAYKTSAGFFKISLTLFIIAILMQVEDLVDMLIGIAFNSFLLSLFFLFGYVIMKMNAR